jgi:hypothetical protein
MHKQLFLTASAIILLAGTVFLTAVPAQTQGPLPWSTQIVPPKPNKQRQHQSRIGGGTYRTLCVRACDGYYFPISDKVTRAKFNTDSIACLQRCTGGEARLFVHRNPGQKISSAVDLQGNRYVELDNAFRYRKELVEGCVCKPALSAETGAGR